MSERNERPSGESETVTTSQTSIRETQPLLSDQSFTRNVRTFFAAERRVAELAADDEDEYVPYLHEVERQLTALGDVKRRETLKPADTALALSELVGVMAVRNPAMESSAALPEVRRENERLYAEAKGLFLKAGDLVFGVDSGAKRDVDPSLLIKRLGKEVGIGMVELSTSDKVRLLKENPKELARRIDEVLWSAGNQLRSKALQNFSETDPARYQKMNGELLNAAEFFHQLQGYRDELQKNIYGRADVAPTEVKRIDEIRETYGAKPEASQVDAFSPEALSRIDIRSLRDGAFMVLYESQPTVEAVIKVVTPEHKRALLQMILKDIDDGIKGAEAYVKANPGSILNRKGLAHFSGASVAGADAAPYQKVAIATERRVVAPTDLAKMPVADYLKRYLGYDLASDKKRSEALKLYTNALG